MKIQFRPQSKPGKWSLGLIILMPFLFILGTSSVNLLYASVPAGGTIIKDIVARPVLALTMLAGMAAGILAFITGIVAKTRKNERSVLVYGSTLVGFLLILFLAGESLFPE